MVVYVILFILAASGLGYYTYKIDRAIYRRYTQTALDAIEAAKQSVAEEAHKQEEEDSSVQSGIKLQFNKAPLFDASGIPLCSDQQLTYWGVLDCYDRWYDRYQQQRQITRSKETWLRPALKELKEQNEAADFAYHDILDLLQTLERYGLTTNAVSSCEMVQRILNNYSKNCNDTVQLLALIHSTRGKKLSEKQRSKLQSLINDNNRLLGGLDDFATSIRGILAKAFNDQDPAHLTDFTDLDELAKVPEMINQALALVEGRTNPDTTDVPVIDFPKTERRSTMEFFTNLGINSGDQAEEPDPADTLFGSRSSTQPSSDGF